MPDDRCQAYLTVGEISSLRQTVNSVKSEAVSARSEASWNGERLDRIKQQLDGMEALLFEMRDGDEIRQTTPVAGLAGLADLLDRTELERLKEGPAIAGKLGMQIVKLEAEIEQLREAVCRLLCVSEFKNNPCMEDSLCAHHRHMRTIGTEVEKAADLRGALERIRAFAPEMTSRAAIVIADRALRGKEPLFGEDLEGEALRCHAGKDGDCIWPGCPQIRDDEPAKTGRHCPLDVLDDEQ